MPYPQQCPAVYDRILPDEGAPVHVRCTYAVEHTESNPRHSWETLKVLDDLARAEAVAPLVTAAPADLLTVIDKIRSGALDDFVEVLLAEGHDRKRARRGVPGFPRTSARTRGGALS